MVQTLIRRTMAVALGVALALAAPAGVSLATVSEETIMTAPMPPWGGPMEPPKRPEPKVSEAEALKILQAAFPDFRETEGRHIESYLDGWGDFGLWSFHLYSVDVTMKGDSLSASVDAMTGRIRQYSTDRFGTYQQIPTGPQTAGHTEDEAQQAAKAFLTGLLKQEMAGLELFPLPAGAGAPDAAFPNGAFHFMWTQQHKGYPVPDSAVMVAVDKATLEVLQFFDNRQTDLEFADRPVTVSAEQALKTWIDNANPHLAFHTLYAPYGYGSDGLRLVYRFDGVHAKIDAATGKLVDEYPEEQPGATTALEAGEKPVLPAALPLTDDAAIALAAQFMGLPEGARPDIINRGDLSNLIDVIWREDPQGMHVTFDRRTGMILSASHESKEGEPPMMDRVTGEREAQAEQAAISLVQTYYSQFLGDLRLETANYPSEKESGLGVRNFRFQRYSQGVPVESDSIYISIDLESLTWLYVSAQWVTQPIPSTDGAVSPDAALQAYFKGLKPRLVYMPVSAARPLGKNGDMEPMEQPAKYALYYTLSMESMGDLVDAHTGQKITWDGEPVGAAAAALASIQGHWAEGELRYLLSNRIIRSDKFSPDAAVTRAQALQMILRSGRGYYDYAPAGKPAFDDVTDESPYYWMVMEASQQGWLQPIGSDKLFRPEAPVTRAEFVVWMARALQLGDLARSGLSVGFEYRDLAGLPAEDQKAATFLRAVGLLRPVETFRGSDSLTTAEGAALMARLHNYQFSNGK